MTMESDTTEGGEPRLSTARAAEILGVSGATVRNWCRAGHLPAVSRRPLVFSRAEIEALAERIRTNRFNRLRKRANKTASDRLGDHGSADAGLAAEIDALRDLVLAAGGDPAAFLFVAALHFLRAMDEAALPDQPDIDLAAVHWRRRSVADVMRGWRRRIPGPLPNRHPGELSAFFANGHAEDVLGLLYQSLSTVGKKARTGAFFTPGHIIDAALDGFGVAPDSFLDPCCGTGRYLIRAARRFGLDPARLHGFDSDPVAVDIARLNLLVIYRDHDFAPDVRCLDTLGDLANGGAGCDTNHLLGSVHAIATNPPWGGNKNAVRNKYVAELVRSGEPFSLFLEKSLRLLREGGLLSFVLPEAMLKIKTHADIRRLLLAEASIRRITLLGRVFPGVFTSVVRLDLEKKPAPTGWKVAVDRGGKLHHCPQDRFAANPGHAFDITVTPRDEELIERIRAIPHRTLAGNADWALGIVTGDNCRRVLDLPAPDTEPVLRGRDIFKFAFREPRSHIRFRPETFQQVAPERFYRAPEKLVYRFVSDRLVFAYDNRGLLTLNSANILIPHIPGLPIKAALAFLNSRVFQYLFTKRFRTRKILRGDLETLPFPILPPDTLHALEDRVEHCMTGEYRPAEELDRMIDTIFRLTPDDTTLMESSLAAEAETSYL